LSYDSHAKNLEPEHFLMRDAQDVKCGYALFLLRAPDDDDHIRGWIGKGLQDMASAFLNSAEFSLRLAPRLDARPSSQATFGIVPGELSVLFRVALKRFCGLEPASSMTGMSGWRWALFWLSTLPPIRDVVEKVTLSKGSLLKVLCEHVTWDAYGTSQDETSSGGDVANQLETLSQLGSVSYINSYGISGQIHGNFAPSSMSVHANLLGENLWPAFFEREASSGDDKKTSVPSTRFIILFDHDTTNHALTRGIENEIRRRARSGPNYKEQAFSICVVSTAPQSQGQVFGSIAREAETRNLEFWAELADIDLGSDESSSRSALETGRAHWAASTGLPKLIAFYLPQFYPFAENDTAWGEGFSEWTNVVGAPKLFPDHRAQLLPADLGFYDLRARETRTRQAELALQNGINGFCYYFYWFSGRQVMSEVLQRILRDGQPSLPFCLCWANENWNRRWDGSEAETIIAQTHGAHTDCAIIDDLVQYFDDPRYIRIDGAPLFLIYHLSLMDEPEHFILNLRARAKELGFPNLALAGVLSHGEPDPVLWGCDYGVQFPPHEMGAREISSASLGVGSEFSGAIYDYAAAGEAALAQKRSSKVLPGVMPRWDNSARRGQKAHLFHGASPIVFKQWLRAAIAKTLKENPEAPFVFINSWNEWAEGAVLEPDRHNGRAYLETVREAVNSPILLHDDNLTDFDSDPLVTGLVHENRFLGAWLASHMPLIKSGPLRPGLPPVCESLPVDIGPNYQILKIDGVDQSALPSMPMGTSCILNGQCLAELSAVSVYKYLLVENLDNSETWFLPCVSQSPERQVTQSDFQVGLSTKGLAIGSYQLFILDIAEHFCFKSTLGNKFYLTDQLL
jgi:hypothetical protein